MHPPHPHPEHQMGAPAPPPPHSHLHPLHQMGAAQISAPHPNLLPQPWAPSLILAPGQILHPNPQPAPSPPALCSVHSHPAQCRERKRMGQNQGEVYYAHDKLDDFINVVNIHLQPFFMQIRKGMSEDDGRTYYALVNLAETEISKMASDYTENELELFRKTMDVIIISESGFASSTNILNLADQFRTKKMKKKEAEQVLQNLVQDKWLSERDGEYTLHTRCIMEMEQYILSNYQDLVRKCNICHSLAIQSQVCETCGIGMHLPCAGKYFKAQTEPHCPHCNEFWPHEIPEINRPDSQVPSSAPRERRRTSSSGTRRR